MTAYPQHPYPTPSPSPQPPKPRLSHKPTFVRQVRQPASPPASPKFITRPIPPCYYDRTSTSFISPLDIPSVAPCPSPTPRPATPVYGTSEEEADRRNRAALKAAENSKDGNVGRSISKEKARREELGLKVSPPTPTTRHYMRKALPPVPGATPTPHSRTDTGRVEKSRRSGKAPEGKRAVNF